MLWFWVSPAGDGKYVTPHWGWDGMISLPRHLDVDTELLQILLYPVKELEVLRVSPPAVQETAMRLAVSNPHLSLIQSSPIYSPHLIPTSSSESSPSPHLVLIILTSSS